MTVELTGAGPATTVGVMAGVVTVAAVVRLEGATADDADDVVEADAGVVVVTTAVGDPAAEAAAGVRDVVLAGRPVMLMERCPGSVATDAAEVPP